MSDSTCSREIWRRAISSTACLEIEKFKPGTFYSLPATADSIGFPYQSDFFSDRQNFFETPSTRTRTSSFEGGVEWPESRVECVWKDIRGGEWLVTGVGLLLRAQFWGEGDLFEINKCTKPAEHFNQQDKQRVLVPGCCAGKHENLIHQRLKLCEWDRFHWAWSRTSPPSPGADHQIALPIATTRATRARDWWRSAQVHSRSWAALFDSIANEMQFPIKQLRLWATAFVIWQVNSLPNRDTDRVCLRSPREIPCLQLLSIGAISFAFRKVRSTLDTTNKIGERFFKNIWLRGF